MNLSIFIIKSAEYATFMSQMNVYPYCAFMINTPALGCGYLSPYCPYNIVGNTKRMVTGVLDRPPTHVGHKDEAVRNFANLVSAAVEEILKNPDSHFHQHNFSNARALDEAERALMRRGLHDDEKSLSQMIKDILDAKKQEPKQIKMPTPSAFSPIIQGITDRERSYLSEGGVLPAGDFGTLVDEMITHQSQGSGRKVNQKIADLKNVLQERAKSYLPGSQNYGHLPGLR
ncbi:MAG: hypothetical protein V1744_04040 [Candidatus Altiarchaeota archaeon]